MPPALAELGDEFDHYLRTAMRWVDQQAMYPNPAVDYYTIPGE